MIVISTDQVLVGQCHQLPVVFNSSCFRDFTKMIVRTLFFLMLPFISGENFDYPGMRLGIEQQDTITSHYSKCLPDFTDETLEVVTWNLEFFPLEDQVTIDEVEEVIEALKPDVVALQEINQTSKFQELDNALENYSGFFKDVSGSLELAYLFRNSTISNIADLSTPLPADSYSFPRPPVFVSLDFNNERFTLINLHLKCCGGSGNKERRTAASNQLKSYIDAELSDANVIVLGDFNESLVGHGSGSFSNFIMDSGNYQFADYDVSLDSSSQWSYPSFPSDIDHILITNELFDNLEESKTIILEGCLSNIAEVISDHRAVYASFSF